MLDEMFILKSLIIGHFVQEATEIQYLRSLTTVLLGYQILLASCIYKMAEYKISFSNSSNFANSYICTIKMYMHSFR